MKNVYFLITIVCLIFSWNNISISSSEAKKDESMLSLRRQVLTAWGAEPDKGSLEPLSLANKLKNDFDTQLSSRNRRRASCPSLIAFLQEEQRALHNHEASSSAPTPTGINKIDEGEEDKVSACAARSQQHLNKSHSDTMTKKAGNRKK